MPLCYVCYVQQSGKQAMYDRVIQDKQFSRYLSKPCTTLKESSHPLGYPSKKSCSSVTLRDKMINVEP